MIRISAKREGFRRCGVAHHAAPTDWPEDAWSAEQLAVLQAEPMLVVELMNTPRKGSGAASGAASEPADGQGAPVPDAGGAPLFSPPPVPFLKQAEGEAGNRRGKRAR